MEAWGVRGPVKFDTYKHLRKGVSRLAVCRPPSSGRRKPKRPRAPTVGDRVSQMEIGTALRVPLFNGANPSRPCFRIIHSFPSEIPT